MCIRDSLLNSSGADLGSSGLTSNNTSFTVNNLPAGNYYFALYGISTGAFANGGTSILQHVTTPVSMKVPFTINPYVQPSVSGVLVAPCPNTSLGSLIATPLNGVAQMCIRDRYKHLIMHSQHNLVIIHLAYTMVLAEKLSLIHI